MVIYPEIAVAPDMPTIRFRDPREKVNLDVELPKILHAQGWGCGTYFHVQFLSHDKSTLLASALFVVSQVSETLHTSEANPYQPVTKTIFGRKADQIGNWFVPSLAEGPEMTATEVKARIDRLTINWNPGKKLHQVKMGDKVVFESPDKDIANQVAEGKVPVPDAA